MIFLKVTIDNFYMFKDTTLDLTYKKKLPSSTIEHEYLEGVKSFNYKRVCIISGANASGKTALSKMMCNINNFLIGRDLGQDSIQLSEKICNKDKSAKFYVEFITPDDLYFHQIEVVFDSKGIVKESYFGVKILENDSYGSARKKLNKLVLKQNGFIFNRNDDKFNYGLIEPGYKSVSYTKGKLKIIPNWSYLISENTKNINQVNMELHLSTALMFDILHTFDSSIVQVQSINESNKQSYIVKFKNKDEAFIVDGEIENPQRLSRGTVEALELVGFIQRILESTSGTFFLDEKLAYSHSEIEQVIITLLISRLGKGAQFFYTTHNYDILDLNLPSHSYVFLKKVKFTEIIHPEKIGHNQNDRKLLNYVKNDVFGTLPDTNKLFGLM